MNTLFFTILIGISLSMDAFSLALLYGTVGLNKNKKILLSMIVGIYHFFMPLLGLSFGNIITRYLIVNVDILVSIIFTIIGMEMIISSLKNKEEKLFLSIPGFFIFGLSVSIDSFSTGIGLKVINSNYYEVSIIFCLISGIFTYFGLILGNKLNERYGKISTLIGGIFLIIFGLYYLLR